MPNGLFEKLQLDAKQREAAKQVSEKRATLATENEQVFAEYRQATQEGNVEQASSVLERGLQQSEKFKGELTDLTESLSRELGDLGNFFDSAAEYHGLETVLSKVPFMKKQADRMRIGRVKNSDVKVQMQTILDYGHTIVEQLYESILDNMRCHSEIQAAIGETVKTLEENQPLYDTTRQKRENLERQIGEIDTKIAGASANEYAPLESQKTLLQTELHATQVNENDYFVRVDKARKALPVQRQHADSYNNMVDALSMLRTGLEQDITSVTQLYLNVPTAIQTMLKTKGASLYDKANKATLEKSTATVLAAAAGVLDETASRLERPLLEADKLAFFNKMRNDMRANFDERTEKLKQDYAAPHA